MYYYLNCIHFCVLNGQKMKSFRGSDIASSSFLEPNKCKHLSVYIEDWQRLRIIIIFIIIEYTYVVQQETIYNINSNLKVIVL